MNIGEMTESKIERWSLLALSEAILIVTMVLTVLEIILRGALHYSLEVTDEISSYLLVALFFFSITVCHKNGAFHQVELVQAKLSPRMRAFSQIVFDILNLAVCLILLWFLLRFEWLSYVRSEASNSTLALPLWIPRITMPIGMIAMCLALVATIGARIRNFSRYSSENVSQ